MSKLYAKYSPYFDGTKIALFSFMASSISILAFICILAITINAEPGGCPLSFSADSIVQSQPNQLPIRILNSSSEAIQIDSIQLYYPGLPRPFRPIPIRLYFLPDSLTFSSENAPWLQGKSTGHHLINNEFSEVADFDRARFSSGYFFKDSLGVSVTINRSPCVDHYQTCNSIEFLPGEFFYHYFTFDLLCYACKRSASNTILDSVIVIASYYFQNCKLEVTYITDFSLIPVKVNLISSKRRDLGTKKNGRFFNALGQSKFPRNLIGKIRF